MTTTTSADRDRAVDIYLARLNGRAWGLALGGLLGVGLFAATNILLLKGGQNVGEHLKLLGHYFPGYDVTFFGSLLGLAYGFVVGYATGRGIGGLYNLISRGRAA